MREELEPLRVLSPAGRRGRLSFFLVGAIYGIALGAVALVVFLLLTGIAPMLAAIGGAPFLLLVAGVWICLYVQRLHDLGQSGWWVVGIVALQLVAGLPSFGALSWIAGLAGTIVSLVLLFVPGQPAPNAYGPPPSWPKIQ